MTKTLFLITLFANAAMYTSELPEYGTKECSEQDGPCSTGGSPKAPTPSPKNQSPATTPRGK